MRLLRTKVWNWVDIGLLKWCATLFGMIVGAYFHEFVQQHVWFFVVGVIILAIKPTISYYKD